jgi:hypothetical protein
MSVRCLVLSVVSFSDPCCVAYDSAGHLIVTGFCVSYMNAI